MSLTVPITGPHIDLDQLLKLAGIVASGGDAKLLIRGGGVRLNGERETRRRKKVHPGDRVELDDGQTILVAEAPPEAD